MQLLVNKGQEHMLYINKYVSSIVQDFSVESDRSKCHIRHRLNCNELKVNSYQKRNMKKQLYY